MEGNSKSISYKEQGDQNDFLDGFQQVFGIGSDEKGSSVSSTSAAIDNKTGPSSVQEVPPEYFEESNEEDDNTQNPGQNEDDETETEQTEGTEETEETGSEEEEETTETQEEESEGEEETGTQSTDEHDERTDGSEDNEPDEEEIVDSFFDLFAQELGWDYDEEQKPKSINSLVNYMNDLVQQSAANSFSAPEVKEINDYIANGGSLQDYLEAYNNDVSIENISLEDSVENQKRVIRDHLSKQGFSEENIENKIQRYEDVGTLEEEAQDSLELLKKDNEKEKEKLLTQQEEQRKQREQQQQKFIEDVKSNIDSMKSVKGIPLTQKQKQDLKTYLFETDAQGMTGYQKDYSKSYNNLIESAFFTMQGDDIVKQIQKRANTDATKNLKNRVKKSKGKRSKSQTSGGGSAGSTSSIDMISQMSRLLTN